MRCDAAAPPHTNLGPRGQRRDVVQHGAGLGEGDAVLELLDEGHLGEVEIVLALPRQGRLAVADRGIGGGWGWGVRAHVGDI